MALSVARRIIFDGSYDTTAITKVVETININEEERYTSGAWARKEVTLAAATNMDFNSYFADAFGTTINFATLKELFIWNTDTVKTVALSGNLKTLFMGGDTDDPVIQPDGWWGIANPTGWTIVNAASDTLTLTPSAAGAVVQIFVVGAE